MSSFADYEAIAQHYDTTRIPIGLEILCGCLSQAGDRLDRLRVLDAGCGSGSYAHALLPYVASIEGIDMSLAMLEAARRKLADAAASGRFVAHHGSIASLPWADGHFDAIMVNQVLHHLADDPQAGYPVHRQVLGELARVLRPGGVLVINTCSQAQLRDGIWYYKLMPRRVVDSLCRRYAPLPQLEDLLAASGLVCRGEIVPVTARFQGAAYFHARGPLDDAWRKSDSTWELLSPAELEEVTNLVARMDADGTLEAFRTSADSHRAELGQVTFVWSTRAQT